MGTMDNLVVEAWLENKAMCFALRGYNPQQEGPHGGLSAQGKCSSMVEDTPTSTKHGRLSRVMGKVQGMVPGEVIFRGIH
jgi:hypothetical protein